MTKLYFKSAKAKTKVKRAASIEDTTRESPKDEDGVIFKEFLPGIKHATAKVTVKFFVSGKPEFTEAQLSERIAELLKEIEI